LLITYCTVFEKSAIAEMLKKVPDFLKSPKEFAIGPYLSLLYPVYNVATYCSEIHFNIISTYVYVS
jgi:hypothetical protein